MQEALRRESSKEAQAPFDLKRGPLLRATLITTGEQEYVFLLTMHHIISDAWTLSIFIKEFAELYEGFAQGRPVELAELPIQYIDFACWQRDYLTGDSIMRTRRFTFHLTTRAPECKLFMEMSLISRLMPK